jgi:UDP-N-acetylmuramoylalanine--D-glutamate ligase
MLLLQELDMTNYANKIIELKNKNVIKKILLLSDSTTTGTDILIKSFNEKMFTDYKIVLNLKHAVDAARSAANGGDIILFTPAFASFGMFQNEYDRGEKFNQAVNDLK